MISARPRTMPRMTATPGAIPHSVLPTVLDHCTPAIRGKDDDFHDPLCMYTVPPQDQGRCPGCELLSFLDAYSGYHQIKMKESDQLATSFITPFGMYCYVTMPFGLRNAGATYQRCMLHVFGDHLGHNVEAYVDDIVVKSRKADDLVADLRIAFGCLRAKGVKLNPEKCVFGVPRGMLLVFIVSQRGIEPNPKKVSAITRMGPIRDLKGVQRVMGCLHA